MTDPVKYSRTEREILRLVVAGRAPKEIAGDLERSVKTINTRLKSMWLRAGVGSRHELILWALQHPQALDRDGESAPGLHPEGCQCPAPYCVARRASAA